MFYTKDHKTIDMFDHFAFLESKRRTLLDSTWAGIFRDASRMDLDLQSGGQSDKRVAIAARAGAVPEAASSTDSTSARSARGAVHRRGADDVGIEGQRLGRVVLVIISEAGCFQTGWIA